MIITYYLSVSGITHIFSGYSLILSEKSDYIRNFCVKSDDYNSLFISIWNNAHNFDVQ